MLDIGWQELLVIGALALIVVGPKDLPGMLRSLGQWVGRLRRMSGDFQRAMNDAAREADMSAMTDLKDLKDTMSGKLDFKSQAAKAQSFMTGTDIDPDLPPEKTTPAKVDAAAEHQANVENRAVTQSAPVDKPDPSAMGDAMPKPDPKPATAPEGTETKATGT